MLKNLTPLEVEEIEQCIFESTNVDKKFPEELPRVGVSAVISSALVTINLIAKLLDIYIDHRIKQDKVIEGILKDIQANTQQIADAGSRTIKISSLN